MINLEHMLLFSKQQQWLDRGDGGIGVYVEAAVENRKPKIVVEIHWPFTAPLDQ